MDTATEQQYMDWLHEGVQRLNPPATNRMVNPHDTEEVYCAMNIAAASFYTPYGKAQMSMFNLGAAPGTREGVGVVIMSVPGGGKFFEVADSIQGVDYMKAADRLVKNLPKMIAAQEPNPHLDYYCMVNALLDKHYGLTAEDAGLGLEEEGLSSAMEAGLQPYEVVERHADDHGLTRLDDNEFMPVGPLKEADEKAMYKLMREHIADSPAARNSMTLR
jgi:hypothetical protein|tara:strand:- start:670 stop:1323 length:654 start_codon:yes stop_codon:yes gene_type:complete